MNHVEDWKAHLAEVYRRGLKHYNGDKAKARECVEQACRGYVDRMIMQTKTGNPNWPYSPPQTKPQPKETP